MLFYLISFGNVSLEQVIDRSHAIENFNTVKREYDHTTSAKIGFCSDKKDGVSKFTHVFVKCIVKDNVLFINEFRHLKENESHNGYLFVHVSENSIDNECAIVVEATQIAFI